MPFETFIQQFASSLEPTAPEFVPRTRENGNGDVPEDASRGAVRKNISINVRNRPNYNGNSSRYAANYERGQPHRGRFRQHEDYRTQEPPQNQQHRKQEFPNDGGARPKSRWPKRQSRRSKPQQSKETKCQREKLIREISSNNLECLVCCEKIKDHQSAWSCSTCFHIFHLKCITKWALSSRTDDGDWRCPACQSPKTKVPRDYYCFCGKQRNPGVSRSDVAHSCGEVCGQKCENDHSCTILCHPGPHPSCQASGNFLYLLCLIN